MDQVDHPLVARGDEPLEHRRAHQWAEVVGIVVAQHDDLGPGADGVADDAHVRFEHLVHHDFRQRRVEGEVGQQVVQPNQIRRPHERGAVMEADRALAFVALHDVRQLAEPVRRVGVGRRVHPGVLDRLDGPLQRMRDHFGPGALVEHAPLIHVAAVGTLRHLGEEGAAPDGIQPQSVHAVRHIQAARHRCLGDLLVDDELDDRHPVRLFAPQSGVDAFDGVHRVFTSSFYAGTYRRPSTGLEAES